MRPRVSDITTRSKGEALKLVYESEMVDVLPMGEGEAETLLESKLGRSSQDTRELVLALDCMPLAISQAAAYIRERMPRCTVRQYCAEVEQSRASRTRLLERNVPLTNRDAEANNSVLLTWQISFDHIYSTRRSVAELLSLMSFCDRLAIPETLLWVNLDKSNEGSNGRSGFEEDIVALRSFSFVSHTASAQEWEMHRLVQDATLVWLEGHGRLNNPRAVCPSLIRVVPEWALRELVGLSYTVPTCEERCRATTNQSKSAPRVGHGDASIRMLGAENEVTLASTAMVAWTLRDRGQWQEAEKLEVKVMETSRRVLGGDHPSTLTSMADLASTYRDQGRWKEAEELEVNAMEKSRRVLGGKHPSTLTSMANLASMYWNQGRWKKAEELKVKVIETRVRVLSGEHPDTLTSMANLAATYRDQGRWKEVEVLTSEAAEASRKVLGKTHPDTLARISAFEQIGRRDGLRTVEDGTSTAALAGDEMGSRARLALPDASFHDLVAQDEEVKQATRKKWWRKLVLDRQRSIDLLYNTISY
ncbi:hypothetical protein LTR49_028238 [Elasticomyces elasticus]|nr:hypothetical protein LTR49_028238 [Elasticomyces elasticus]